MWPPTNESVAFVTHPTFLPLMSSDQMGAQFQTGVVLSQNVFNYGYFETNQVNLRNELNEAFS